MQMGTSLHRFFLGPFSRECEEGGAWGPGFASAAGGGGMSWAGRTGDGASGGGPCAERIGGGAAGPCGTDTHCKRMGG